jgi:arsenite methyltransferase
MDETRRIDGVNMPDNGRLRAVTGGMLRPGGYEITERGLGFCKASAGMRVLDAGCGAGLTMRYLRERHGIRAYGVDFSDAALVEARESGGEEPLARAMLESLPFARGSFDGIICECVFCHTAGPVVMGEFFRVLKAGGFLILSDLYRRKASGRASGEMNGPELMTESAIADLLARSGFRVVAREDRTQDLKRLAAGFMLEYGTFPETLFSCGDRGRVEPGAWKDVGYYLLAARAMEEYERE